MHGNRRPGVSSSYAKSEGRMQEKGPRNVRETRTTCFRTNEDDSLLMVPGAMMRGIRRNMT